MPTVRKQGIVLHKTNLGFEAEGVLNPAVIWYNGSIHMYYRAVAKHNYSSIGYCNLLSPLVIQSRNNTPIIFPQFAYEQHGTEDPRIVLIDHTFYLTYTAYDGVNALGALATSTDMVNWTKHGIIVPQLAYKEFNRLATTQNPINEKYARYNAIGNTTKGTIATQYLWDKNVILFPRKIDGKYYMLHRIKPDIQLVSFYDFSELTTEFWQSYLLHFQANIVLAPKYDFGVSYLGGGCPPIETEHGWLLIYHGVHDTIEGYVYVACAALLKLDNPYVEVSRLPYPLFIPQENWELTGEVNNVCFPTGAIVLNHELYIYYGAADERIAVAVVNLNELIAELLLHAIPHA